VSSDTQESQVVDLCVMYVDIRNYTTLTEKTKVTKLAEFINDFFDVVSRIVYANGGFVNKYIGDCVMSLFGLESEMVELENQEDDTHKKAALSAYTAAIEIFKSVNLIRHRYDFAGDIEVGIGIASGPVVAGYFGSRERMEFSVIGSTVNLASRLQGFSNMNMAIVCSKTAEYLNELPYLESHPDVDCKGFLKPVSVKAVKYDTRNGKL